ADAARPALDHALDAHDRRADGIGNRHHRLRIGVVKLFIGKRGTRRADVFGLESRIEHGFERGFMGLEADIGAAWQKRRPRRAAWALASTPKPSLEPIADARDR